MTNHEDIYLEEDSPEWKYYTTIPNMVIETCDSNQLALYTRIKRAAGGKGVCFISNKTMMEKLEIGRVALKTAYQGLEQKNLIRFKGLVERQTTGGIQKVKSYSIVSIWKQNIEFFEGGVETAPLERVGQNSTKGRLKRPKGVARTAPKNITLRTSLEEPVAEKPATDKKSPKEDGNEPMDRVEFVKWCRASPLRHIQLIAEYADEKKIDFNTKEQWREFIKRNVRAARILSPYTDEQIAKAMAQIEKATQGERGYITRWTMETLVKYLDQ